MKLKNEFFSGAVRVFLISLVLSLGMVNPVRAVGDPDLTIIMDDSGDFVQGGVGTYTITVTNSGTGPTSGLVTVDVYEFRDDQLSNITISSAVDWTCSSIPEDISQLNPIRCTRSDVLSSGDSFPSIILSVSVNVDAVALLHSEVDVTGGGDVAGAASYPDTTVTQKPDLTLVKTHTGSTPTPIGSGVDFVQSGVGTYTIIVSNSSAYADTDDSAITVTYALPAGLTLKTVSGLNWDCTVAPACTRELGSRLLNPTKSFDPITLTVDVAWNADESVVNTVTVSGGGEVNTLNSSDSASTAIEQKPDLDITNVTLEPSIPYIGQDFILHITGMNQGTVTSGSIVLAHAFIDPDIADADIWPVPCNWNVDDYTVYASDSNDLTNGPVEAGEPFTRNITVSGGLSAGQHEIYIYTDPGCGIRESVEGNNTYGPITINVPAPITISGNVGGVAGVSLRYAIGGVTKTVSSAANGSYTLYVPSGWTGTVTPVKAGHVFSPLNRPYAIPLTANQVSQNFTLQQYAISGNVKLSGVSLSYVVGGVTKTVTSNASGNYTFSVPSNWIGAVIPSKSGYLFSPMSKSYSTLPSNQVNQNFVPFFGSSAAQDGWVLESTEKSNRGSSLNKTQAVFYLGDNAAKKQYRSILSFDTSFLPDNASITNLKLRIMKGSVVGGGDPVTTFGGFMVDVKKGFFGTLPLTASDFQSPANKTLGPVKPAQIGGWYTLNLINAKTYVNRLGITQIRLRFKLDDNNNAVANYMRFYSGNAGVAYRPMLIIEYKLP